MSNILQTIFFDYYEHIQYELHPRQTVMENVSKMIHCGDPSYGGAMFACPDCGELKFSPFRRKSRFRPTCVSVFLFHFLNPRFFLLYYYLQISMQYLRFIKQSLLMIQIKNALVAKLT
jgi:predicted RNA-binding Zn-ribbon protein involved in translation (DUF1610 family)